MNERTSTIPNLREDRLVNLKRLLKPRHVAFVGGRHMERSINLCRSFGYEGTIWAVNPHYARIAGISCVGAVDDLPQAPDAAFIAVSQERTVDVVSALEHRGAGGAVCHASGFAELGGERKALQDKLVQAAGQLAIVGPNSQGVINYFDGVALWGDDSHAERAGLQGAAIVSQSGAFLYGITNVERAFPLGYAVSSGNQAVLGVGDFMDVLLDDSRVRAIGLYLEGLTHGSRLAAACLRALEQGIPVILLRGGGSEASARRAVSHTGNISVPEDFWLALVERYALIAVSTPKEMVETLKLLVVAGPPAGKRLFAATYSGAAGTLLADRAPAMGLELPDIPAAHSAPVVSELPAEVTASNPLDLNLPWRSSSGMSLSDEGSIAHCLEALARDLSDVIAFFLDIPRTGKGLENSWLPTMEAMARLNTRVRAPCAVVSILPEGLPESVRYRLLDAGVAPLLGLGDGLLAISLAADWSARRQELIDAPGHPAGLLMLDDQPTHAVVLDEWESKQRLEAYGLPTPDAWTGPGADAPTAAAAIGFPVVLKALSDALPHKQQVGGVRLNLLDEAMVGKAVTAIQTAVQENTDGIRVERFLVERMVSDSVGELLLGVQRNPALGLGLVVGRGGSDVEHRPEYAMLLLPTSRWEIEMCLAKLSCIADLGLPAKALSALAEAMEALARYAVDHCDVVVELDVNPLLLRSNGSVVAADALLVMQREPGAWEPKDPTV